MYMLSDCIRTELSFLLNGPMHRELTSSTMLIFINNFKRTKINASVSR